MGMASLMPAHAANAPAANAIVASPCPAPAKLQPLLKLGNIYFGETHGTAESPHLVRCVVDAEVAAGVSPLTVSLELPEWVRDSRNEYWSHLDGRSSAAMQQLVAHLQALEKSGKLKLDFQVPDKDLGDNQALNKYLGEHLRDLAAKGRLIALSGTLHTQRRQALIPSLTFKPAGAYLGDNVKTVWVVALHEGTAWSCSPQCASHDMKGWSGVKVGELSDGDAAGFDYIYAVEQFTASPPALSR